MTELKKEERRGFYIFYKQIKKIRIKSNYPNSKNV